MATLQIKNVPIRLNASNDTDARYNMVYRRTTFHIPISMEKCLLRQLLEDGAGRPDKADILRIPYSGKTPRRISVNGFLSKFLQEHTCQTSQGSKPLPDCMNLFIPEATISNEDLKRLAITWLGMSFIGLFILALCIGGWQFFSTKPEVQSMSYRLMGGGVCGILICLLPYICNTERRNWLGRILSTNTALWLYAIMSFITIGALMGRYEVYRPSYFSDHSFSDYMTALYQSFGSVAMILLLICGMITGVIWFFSFLFAGPEEYWIDKKEKRRRRKQAKWQQQNGSTSN